jgi:nicotinamidase/pyrazinamidase
MMRVEDLKLVKPRLAPGDALIIVDLQRDFMPGGALPVEGGDEIVGPTNELAAIFNQYGLLVVMTQDWHPPGHRSFASAHGKKPYEPYVSEGIGPVLWPDHCVQGTLGAEFHPQVNTRFAGAIIRKGYRLEVDSYSAFIENDRKTPTGLEGYLSAFEVRRVYLCGLALDYCVHYSALDARALGLEVIVPIDLTRPVNFPPEQLSHALELMVQRGVQFTKSEAIQ